MAEEKAEKKPAKAKGKGKGKAAELEPAAPKQSDLKGPTKAALWLLSVDEELAVEILSHLNDAEIAQLSAAVKSIPKTTPAELTAIHHEFNQNLALDPLALNGGFDYLGRIASKALGEDRANEVLGIKDAQAADQPPLETADLDILSSILKDEHPQVVAAVLANLNPIRGAELVKKLPESLKKDVVLRMASLSRIPRTTLLAAENVLSEALPASQGADKEVDGIRTAAQLLNNLDNIVSDEILQAMEDNETQAPTAKKIRQAMFTFEDLGALDRKGFSTLLKEVESSQLLKALKTASNDIKDKVFASLSKRAAEMLRDDLEVMGPVRLAEVSEAQQSIVTVALQLKQEGKLMISGGQDEFV